MRASLFVIAAATATMLAAAVPASSASAQGVAIEGGGMGVRVGEPDRYRERRGETSVVTARVVTFAIAQPWAARAVAP